MQNSKLRMMTDAETLRLWSHDTRLQLFTEVNIFTIAGMDLLLRSLKNFMEALGMAASQYCHSVAFRSSWGLQMSVSGVDTKVVS